MGLLDEIQQDAVTDETPISTLLRKCLVLASRLESDVLEDWVRHELNGYASESEVPTYRRMQINFKANISNVAYRYQNHSIAPYFVEKATRDPKTTTFYCRQAVGTLPQKDEKENGTFHISMANLGLLVQKQLEPGNFVESFWGEVPASALIGIPDAVRSRVLDFALALGKKYPQAGAIDGSFKPDRATEMTVSQLFINNIQGNAGVIGNATNSTTTVSGNIINISDLKKLLSESGLMADDLRELEGVLAAEPSIGPDKKFGPKVSAWMASMLGKAASGVWGISLGAGGALLEKALLAYYGYS